VTDLESLYQDRAAAGRRLADALDSHRGEPVTVVALPRGGVPVAFEIARRLGAPLDLLLVRKVGAPGNPELGLGAVAEEGVRFLDEQRAREVGVDPRQLDDAIAHQAAEVERRRRMLRAIHPGSSIRDRVVILVDDGMATGGTMRAAAEAVRRRKPLRLIAAVGVASREALETVRPFVDELVCPLVPPALFAVGEWFREFRPVPEREVTDLLRRSREPGSCPSEPA
jgi:putative phosphoribosyl transferase